MSGFNGSYPPPYTPPVSPSPGATAVLPRQRTWLPVLVLYLLAPVCGEVLSGSTPPLQFLTPFSFLTLTAFYGSGAVLVRELARRNRLGWLNILLLGAAYGVLEEGLVVMSWFNPYWPDLGKLAYYGRFLDTSWVWATELTIYHAIVSITIPVLLTELLFPRVASRPWLGPRSLRWFEIWLGFVSILMAIGFGFLAYRRNGFTHPPLMYLGALLLAVGLLWSALRLRVPTSRSPLLGNSLPGLWRLRLLAFGAAFAFFFTAWVLPNLAPFPPLPILLFFALVYFAGRWIFRWSRYPSWGAQQRLALASGVMAFFATLAPLVELFVHPAGKVTTGLTLVNLAFLGFLALLAHTVARRGAQ